MAYRVYKKTYKGEIMFNNKKKILLLEARLDVAYSEIEDLTNALRRMYIQMTKARIESYEDGLKAAQESIHDVPACPCGCYNEDGE